MHEISIAESIVQIAETKAREQNARSIQVIKLRLGTFTTIVPEALQFAFEICREGKLSQNARLDIEIVPMLVRCVVCVASTQPMGGVCLICAHCGFPLEIVSGEELQIEYIEVDSEKEGNTVDPVPERISVQTNVLNANQQTAAANRERFVRDGLLVMNLMSAPGAGKTTLLEATIKALKRQLRIAVIEGDLQTELDAQRIEALGVRAYQITTGTVCHLDARMVARALEVFPVTDIDLLVIENVGNLICPASFDLGESLRVVVASVAEGADKPKKYPVMFNKADVILINKIDLAAASGVDVKELAANVREVSPHATMFALSSRTGEGMAAWTEWLQHAVEVRVLAAASV